MCVRVRTPNFSKGDSLMVKHTAHNGKYIGSNPIYPKKENKNLWEKYFVLKKMNNLLTLFIIFTPILIITLLVINLYLPVANPDLAKVSPYE